MDQFDLVSSEEYQYYSVGEWIIRGTCMCNGHASTCAPAPGESLASDKVCFSHNLLFMHSRSTSRSSSHCSKA